MDILSAIQVSKSYANHKALSRLSVTVKENSIFGLLGPNGAGKTTFIRMITQITAPDEGRLLFNGRPMQPDDYSKIGYLPEERGLYKKMKVGEQALYFARLKGMTRSDARESLNKWFDRFEITPWWNKKVEELSKGMQQKLQFIITVVHRPQLLIFDEPFSGFDPINARQLKSEILRLKAEGATILFSTHQMESVEELCDHIVLLNQSHKVLDGSIHEIRDRYREGIFEVEIPEAAPVQQLQTALQTSLIATSVKNGSGRIQLKLRKPKGKTNNEMLRELMQLTEVISFQEQLPRMNEIFIQVINQSKNRHDDDE